MPFLRQICAALGALMLVASPATAEIWRVAPDQSSVAFAYTEDGEERSGAFKRFSGRGTFSPDRPRSARLQFEIRIDSIDLPDRFRTEFVKGPVWFDAEAHPKAKYQLQSLQQLADGEFLATGQLTIKGVTKQIETPLTLQIEQGRARAAGVFSFDRYDFGVGDSGGIIDVGSTVEVRFDLVAAGR